MKSLLLIALLPLVSLGATMPQLPPGEFADTEMSTNLPLSVAFGETSRVEFTISLVASPTSALEVAIGRDADGDGRLAVEEAAWTFGYDCGEWFSRETAANRETRETAAMPAEPTRLSRTFVLRKRKLSPDWTLVRVTRRGNGDIAELTAVEGKALGLKLLLL